MCESIACKVRLILEDELWWTQISELNIEIDKFSITNKQKYLLNQNPGSSDKFNITNQPAPVLTSKK